MVHILPISPDVFQEMIVELSLVRWCEHVYCATGHEEASPVSLAAKSISIFGA